MSEPETTYSASGVTPSPEAFTPAPIRYRVFDPATGEMYYPDGVGDGTTQEEHTVTPSGGVLQDSGTHVEDWRVTGCIPLLSTGLRDANGVEVFEGDMIEHEYPDIPSPATVKRYNDSACFMARTHRGAVALLYVTDCEAFRVVGNVYQGLTASGE